MIVIFGITTLDFAEIQKMVQNKKKTNLGQKMPYLGILACKFENALSYFQHLRICQTAKFRAKLKPLTLGPKMPYLGVFMLHF